jgi:hypothetical protein
VGLAWASFAAGIAERAAGARDPWLDALPEGSRRALAGGAAFQLAGALYAEGRAEDASRALARAAELLPARLLAEAEADPTAAELWHAEPR